MDESDGNNADDDEGMKENFIGIRKPRSVEYMVIVPRPWAPSFPFSLSRSCVFAMLFEFVCKLLLLSSADGRDGIDGMERCSEVKICCWCFAGFGG